ncbi:MAG: glycosyltransferase family 2 protein [Candidatus Accumulibacter sp.]|jgi:glycosyltransferase involved in cell wall biosynthesis|nr:glycosyltransferase family 2 protein [Accumulibacter sp.]
MNSHALPTPLLSIIIPAYNYANVLQRAVDSVLTQASAEVELWVIDDGSTDTTPAVFAALSERYGERFQGVRQENSGLAFTRNRGVHLARGRFMLFLDADDELVVGVLPTLCGHLREHPDIDFWQAGHVAVLPDGRERQRPASALPRDPIKRLRDYLLDKKISLSNGACVFSRELLLRRPYPDYLRHSEDIPVFAYALAQEKIEVLDLLLTRVHKHSDSMRHNVGAMRKVGMALVDEVFSRLPAHLQSLKSAYRAQRYLSLFRACLLAGEYNDARAYYREALLTNWRVLLKWSYTRKAVRLCLGLRE